MEAPAVETAGWRAERGHGLNQDLGSTDEGRHENIRRTAEVARLMADASLIVLALPAALLRRQEVLERAPPLPFAGRLGPHKRQS